MKTLFVKCIAKDEQNAAVLSGAVLTVDGGLSISDGGPNWNA